MGRVEGAPIANRNDGDPVRAKIFGICREVLAPLIRADGGEMYLVGVSSEDIHIHLSGACAGCPGAALTRDRVLLPILAAAAPKLKLVLTTGWRVPDGATKIDPA